MKYFFSPFKFRYESMRFGLLFLFLIFNLHAEESCREVNINIENMPKNTDQGPLYWCAAFTSADFLSFYEKQSFSAYDMAITYQAKREDIPKKYKTNYGALSGFPDDLGFHAVI